MLQYNLIPRYNCTNSKGQLTVTIQSPATPPFTVTSSPSDFSGTSATNTYTFITSNSVTPGSTFNFTIVSANNCSVITQASWDINISPSDINIATTSLNCHGDNTGAISAVFIGADPPVTWLWSNNSTNSSISGIPAGSYSVTATNSSNCSVTKVVSVTQPSIIVSTLSSTFIPCFSSTISPTITTSGGIAPFTYTVNGNPISVSPGNIATNLSAGLQSIITKDAKGCIKTNAILIDQAAQQIISSTVTSPLCPNQSNGSIHVSVNGPVAINSYSWNPGASGNATLSNIASGNYTIYLSDASNCITTSVITVPPAPSVNVVSVVKKENCSAVDGAFTLTVSGGFPPYTYTTLPVNTNGNVVTGLSSGAYKTIIMDSHACVDSTNTYIGNLSTVSLNILTITPVQCYKACNGSVLLNVQNAVLPITYSLTGFPVTTNSVISNLCAGFYLVKAVDNIGCPAFDTINFPTLAVFSYSAVTPPTICIGKYAKLSASAFGGTGALSYIWNPGSLTGATVNVEPTVTTIYSLNVYDSKGCTLPSYSVTVKVNPQISININSSNAGICPGTTAQITPTITGGDGNYSYEWLPSGSKGSSIYVESIVIPTYTLTVNDACGSPKGVKEITIKLHPFIKPVYKQENEAGCAPFCTNFINVTPNSKNAIWSFGERPFEQKGDSTFYCYEKSGKFNLRLTVTDSNYCKASYTYTNAVNVLVKPSAGFITNPTIITLNDAENVEIKNTSVNASDFKWYLNNNKLGTSKNVYYTFRDTGCYDIKLLTENENGCKDSTIRSVCVFEGFNFYMPHAFTPNNDGLNDVLLPKGTGWLYENYKFEVYNRWGHKIFSSNNVNLGWDGGLEVNPYAKDITTTDINDVYSWRVVLTDNLSKVHELQGFVTLVR
ncbi:gliding motility-associated C-terminal domain-containing protein [Aurantibacillus circumpalustris]|uniref:T9SS type B sorting domain-containing protein n=1 Tax=Aurantibacillus circumpalustris TaxID=3036359 RepID=UPI00295A6FDA|nr:gliding motility-associated C-terminal domain-containing protein [Aurantibacillus circumpalustris]